MLRFILLLLFPVLAGAQTVGLHLVSGHASGGLNNANPGAYVRFDNGVTVGTYRNSYRRNSVYLGYTAETSATDRLSLAVTVGAITGYQREEWAGTCLDGHVTTGTETCYLGRGGKVSPLFVPSFAYRNGNSAVRFGLIPNATAKSIRAVHVMVEHHF
jgi:hypothetical protein